MSAAPQPATPPRGWILYDAQCGFCQRSIHLWQKTVERHGFAVKSLQAAQAEHVLQLPQENVLDDIRVLTLNGQLISGADAYLHISRQIWWTWPFYAVFSLPGFHWLLARTYGWINRNRYRISGGCPTLRRKL
jgi:predicted DCC family thiol-disulfide oxidoreductase YuxK